MAKKNERSKMGAEAPAPGVSEDYEALRALRTKRNALFERDVSTWTDDELIEELRLRCTPPTIPPCRLCGKPLECQSLGGGPTAYACTGVESGVPNWDHYERSRYEDHLRGGDAEVLALIDRFLAKTGSRR